MRLASTLRRAGDGRGIARSSAAAFGGGIWAGLVGLDRDHRGEQMLQGVAEAFVGELVAGAAPVRSGDDQAAVAQAGQIVGQPSAGDIERVGENGGVTGASRRASRIRQRIGSASARPKRASTSMSEGLLGDLGVPAQR